MSTMLQFVVREGKSFDINFKPKVLNAFLNAVTVQTTVIQEEQSNGIMMTQDEPFADQPMVAKSLLQYMHDGMMGRKVVESSDVVAAVEKLRMMRGARSIQTTVVECVALEDFPLIAVDPGTVEYKDARALVANSGGATQKETGGGASSSTPDMASVFNKGTSAAHATGFFVPEPNSPMRRVYAIQQRYHFALAQTGRSPLYVTNSNQQVLQGQLRLVQLKGLEGSSATQIIAVLGVLTYDACASSPTVLDRKKGGGVAGVGQWYLEDCSMKVELGITEHTTALSCGIFAAGAIVIARGTWDGGRLIVQGFNFPPPEPRSKSLSITNTTDCFGLAPHDPRKALSLEKDSETTVVTCAHVHLDKPETLVMFQLLLGRLVGMVPSSFTFVFVGDFSSQPRPLGDPSFHEEGSRTFYHEMTQHFTNLGEVIKNTAPSFAAQSSFIFVPGPTDITSCGNTLPTHPLSRGLLSGFTTRCPKTTLSPNPCRLRFGTYEVVIARLDSQRLWKKPRVVRPLQTAEDGTTIYKKFDHVAKTMIEQHTVAPFLGIGNGGAGNSGTGGSSGAAAAGDADSTEPIWSKDHTLRLFPLPHMLVCCDSSEQWETPCGETQILNPGCFSLESTFLWMSPNSREYQINVVSSE